jgi:hypothetical protein
LRSWKERKRNTWMPFQNGKPSLVMSSLMSRNCMAS